MIIGLSGKKCSGKDTAAAFLMKNYGGARVAFADAMKDAASHIILGLTGETVDFHTSKGDRERRFLQEFGMTMRNWRDSVWVDLAMEKAARLMQDGAPHVYIPDVRFPNEVEAIEATGGAVIRVNTNEAVRRGREALLYGTTDPARASHASETALDFHPFDWVVPGDGLEMYGKLELVMAQLQEIEGVTAPDASVTERRAADERPRFGEQPYWMRSGRHG